MEQQEELKRKVNKLFDTRASSPLIINKLKKTDTVLSKVNNINENYFASRGKSPRVIHAVYVDSIAKKKASASAIKVNLIKEEVEEEKEDLFDSSLLTTDPSDVNNVYFKNLQPNHMP